MPAFTVVTFTFSTEELETLLLWGKILTYGTGCVPVTVMTYMS